MEVRMNKKVIFVIGLILVVVVAVMFGIRGIMGIWSSNDQEEIAKIEQAFIERFAFVDEEYAIKAIRIINDEYAGVVLTIDNLTHKAVLRKEDDGWTVIKYPEVVLTYSEFSDVPRDVIKTINSFERE